MVRPTPHNEAACDTDNVFLVLVIKGVFSYFPIGYIGNLAKYLTTYDPLKPIESENTAQCRNFDEIVDQLNR